MAAGVLDAGRVGGGRVGGGRVGGGRDGGGRVGGGRVGGGRVGGGRVGRGTLVTEGCWWWRGFDDGRADMLLIMPVIDQMLCLNGPRIRSSSSRERHFRAEVTEY
ncbi:hypothetical protein [Paenibacillus sp. FSL R7-0331]|uniref:hypothetical protein n=1 Tax=Paenibacillus sp. FSL R7-0331 TaxID=1536773 RepID=UPI000693A61D|nr:hypothetical protein [Paenibacillus sp. FSL R7-0331]